MNQESSPSYNLSDMSKLWKPFWRLLSLTFPDILLTSLLHYILTNKAGFVFFLRYSLYSADIGVDLLWLNIFYNLHIMITHCFSIGCGMAARFLSWVVA